MSRWPRALARARAPGIPAPGKHPRESPGDISGSTPGPCLATSAPAARATSKNSSAGTLHAPSESVMNARARAGRPVSLRQPRLYDPPGVEGLPAGPVARLSMITTGARDPFALERRHAGPDTLIPIASKGRASWFTTAIWRSQKVFSAVFVTSAAVAAIGMNRRVELHRPAPC